MSTEDLVVSSEETRINASKELTNIHEDEEEVDVNEDSDGVDQGPSPVIGRPPSCADSVESSGSAASASASKVKRRSWKKPKDKPKRPLSAYNIFFKHERSRIVDGHTDDASPEETVRSIELILSTSRETRRHRKTHGRISFGDLARRIADKWKAIGTDHKALFEHYAELDMRRYRREVQIWKDKKEHEAFVGKSGAGQDGSTSNPSYSDSVSEYSETLDPPVGFGGMSAPSHDAWAPRRGFQDSFNSSFSSVDSEFSMDHLPVGMQLLQLQQQQQRQHNRFAGNAPHLHASMPNLGFGGGFGGPIPGVVHSSGGTGFVDRMQFDEEMSPSGFVEHSLSMGIQQQQLRYQQQQQLQQQQQHQQQQQQQQHSMQLRQHMNSLHHSFSGPLRERKLQRPSLTSVPMFVGSDPSGSFPPDEFDSPFPTSRGGVFGFQAGSSPVNNSMDPVPFDEVFPDDIGGKDIGNYLSTLDLSNV